ncbi:hypothetical protein [Saccharicrinis fermentans]|uniref:hypothetical protein n=1 Tax=Saccharicrinis fermentans TaxID=982 RepID=UPI0004BC3F22|nr:hypothetical protein [Saccharicrinis fermentans]
MIFLFSLSVSGQESFQKYDMRARSISEKVDMNEKKYQLAEFAKDFSEFLTYASSSSHINDSTYIKYTKSSDSKYEIFYFNTFKEEVIYRVDWFVLYGETGEKKCIHGYQDKIRHHSRKGNGALRLSLSRLNEEGMTFYPLTFSFVSEGKIYLEFCDVATMCLFEEILKLNTSGKRVELNDEIEKRMTILWNNPENFSNDFKGLKRISSLFSDDKKVKVCTWNLPLPNASNNFYGAVIVKTDRGIKVSKLVDNTQLIRSPERSSLSAKKWYGAIYYDLISTQDSKKRKYYVLLGYKPNNEMTKKKVIETMQVVGNGQVRFGHSVFQKDRYVMKRLVFEYTAASNMLLRYDKDEKRIILDHLAPSSPLYQDNFRFYGPDFSYDAYVYEKGKWVLYKNVDVRNPKVEEK